MASTSTAAVAVDGTPQNGLLRKLLTEDRFHYEIDTPVVYEYGGKWYTGKITAYDDVEEKYTITYQDDDGVDYIDDPDRIEQMARAARINADDNLYNVGTPVKDGDNVGEIVDYHNQKYHVEWSDGTIAQFSPDDSFDELVDAATPADTPTPTAAPVTADSSTTSTTIYPVKTKVYKDFPEDGKDDWYWGVVTMYEDGVYEIKWSDHTKETYEAGPEMDQMVSDALKYNRGDSKENDPWENGTAVYKVFSDGPYFGEIIAYDDGYYTIRWSDDAIEEYSIEKVDEMVEDAYTKVQADKQAALKLKKEKSRRLRTSMFLIFFCGFGVAAFVFRRRKSAKDTAASKSLDTVTFSSSQSNIMDACAGFRDHDDDGPTGTTTTNTDSLPPVV